MEEVISKILAVPLSIWITSVIAVISIAVALTMIEKKLKKDRIMQEDEENSTIKEIEKLKKSTKPVEEKLVLLNKLSKELFKKEFGIDPRTTFSELSEETKKYPKKVSEFSTEMNSVYYKQGTATNQKINYLIDSILSIKIKNPKEKKTKRALIIKIKKTPKIKQKLKKKRRTIKKAKPRKKVKAKPRKRRIKKAKKKTRTIKKKPAKKKK